MNNSELKAKTCCFTGHRDISESEVKEIESWLERLIIELYNNYGVRYYGSGGAMGFDIIAAESVIQVAKRYPQIKLILVLPCPDHDVQWPQIWRARLIAAKKQAAKIVYTSDKYYSGCMHTRNRHLVDHSAWCITYLKRNTGGTAYTVGYAEAKGLRVFRYPDEI